MPAEKVSNQSQGRWIVVALAVIAIAATVGVTWFRIQGDPEIPLLLREGGADWIRFDNKYFFETVRTRVIAHGFRVKFRADSVVAPAMITVRAMRTCEVSLDGQLIHSETAGPANWKHSFEVVIPIVQPGMHELVFIVRNMRGPPMLLAWSDDLDLRTGADWQSTLDLETWSPAALATKSEPTSLSREFPSSRLGLITTWQVAVGVVSLCVAAMYYFRTNPRPKGAPPREFPVAWLRWALCGLWLVLSINDLYKIPLGIGLDADYHEQYVHWIAEKHTLPYATEGWQLFQAPFFYLLSAPVWIFLREVLGVSPDTSAAWLRLMPILSGLVQIELCLRATRSLFPSRSDLQAVGMLVGGLMPMNLYMSQTISNEPLSSCLTAAFIVLAVRALRDPTVARSTRWQILAGGTLGLAILTKVSPVLLIPLAVAVAVVSLRRAGASLIETLRGVGVSTAVCALISGWWFIRNMLKFGKPWMNGWDPARGVDWWQLPGYRTLNDFTTFGESLSYHVFSARAGFWDAMYSTMWGDGYVGAITKFEFCPPWNHSFVAATMILSLLPMGAILLGVWKALRSRDTAERLILWFACVSIGFYLAAMLWLYLKLPIYSTAKASYTLGLLPCYALLAAAGFEILTRKSGLRHVAYVGLVVWAVYSYSGYFVIKKPPANPLVPVPVTGKNPAAHATLESVSPATTTAPAGGE